MAKKKRIYKVTFINEGQIYEVYAKHVGPADMLGFIEIEGFLFGEKSSVVVDPSEEKLQREFAGVERSFIPLQAVIRVDEVERRGNSKIHSSSGDGAKITPFPGHVLSAVKKNPEPR